MIIQKIKDWLNSSKPKEPQYEVVENFKEGAVGPRIVKRLMDNELVERFADYVAAIQGEGDFFWMDVQNFHSDLVHVTIRVYEFTHDKKRGNFKNSRKVQINDLFFLITPKKAATFFN